MSLELLNLAENFLSSKSLKLSRIAVTFLSLKDSLKSSLPCFRKILCVFAKLSANWQSHQESHHLACTLIFSHNLHICQRRRHLGCNVPHFLAIRLPKASRI